MGLQMAEIQFSISWAYELFILPGIKRFIQINNRAPNSPRQIVTVRTTVLTYFHYMSIRSLST